MQIAIDRARLLDNLGRLMLAHAPAGQESPIDALVDQLLGGPGGVLRHDAAGSTIVHIPGTGAAPPVAVAAHKDEIALIVKRVEANGRLRVQPVGGLHPWAVGESPVEILTDDGAVPGVLSVGAKHVSKESPAGQLKNGAPLAWEAMWVETMLDEGALRAAGVRVGRRVVISRSRKGPWFLGNGQYVCGYNLDCRGGLAILAEAAALLAVCPPAGDVYLVASA